MVILLVSNNKNDDELYFKQLLPFTEKDAVIIVNSIERAKEFISTQLIDDGNHIDLVITNYKFGFGQQNGHDLISWLSWKDKESYFKKNLQISSLPVVLFHTDREDTDTDYLLGFDKVVTSRDSSNDKRVQFIIRGAINSWMDSLLNDYDTLNIDPRRPDPFAIGRWNDKCKILTLNYARRPFRLPFIIFQKDIDQAEQEIDVFLKTVNRISNSSRPKQEKLYHQLLMKYPQFMLGQSFDKYFYEHNFVLHQNTKDNYEPDFIRRHKFYKFNNQANLLEIKLPKEEFIVRENFHPKLSATIIGHLTQVKDYQEYFLEPNNRSTIVSELNYLPIMSHSLLLGRNTERDDHLEMLEKRMRQFGSSDIALITYDDLIQKRNLLLQQRQLFRIYSK